MNPFPVIAEKRVGDNQQSHNQRAEERIHDINPDCKVTKWKTFYMPDTADQFDFSQYDYIVDCIDTVTGKLEIITRAKALKKPVISCMGAGNKVDPTKLKVADITRTSVCPLARVMRNELKKRRIKRLKVVFSTETAIPPQVDEADPDFEDTSGVTPDRKGTPKKQTPGSNAFVPSVAGMIKLHRSKTQSAVCSSLLKPRFHHILVSMNLLSKYKVLNLL